MKTRIIIYLFLIVAFTAACMMKDAVEDIVGNDNRLVLEKERWIDEVGISPVFLLTNINFYKYKSLCKDLTVSYFIDQDTCIRDSLGLINGICFYTTRFTSIVLLSDRWKNSPYEKELLIHELAHCLYDIRHAGVEDTPEEIKIMAASGWKTSPVTWGYENCKLINFIRSKYNEIEIPCSPIVP